MQEFDDSIFSLDTFNDRARLLPLKEMVVFPQVLEVFHLTEPKDVLLIEDSLTSDRLVAVGTYRKETTHTSAPRPVEEVACLSRVVAHHRQDAGDYHVVMVGIRRVRLGKDLAAENAFRWVDAELCDDRDPMHQHPSSLYLKDKLGELTREVIARAEESDPQLDSLFDGELPLGSVTDILASMLDLHWKEKLHLLKETHVRHRAEKLLEYLEDFHLDAVTSRVMERFDASFSSN